MDEITLSRPMLSFVYVVYLATEMMFLFIIHGKTASLVAGHIVCLAASLEAPSSAVVNKVQMT